MTLKQQVANSHLRGTLAYNHCVPNLVEAASHQGVELEQLDLETAPKIGLRVYTATGMGDAENDRVLLDVCDFDIVNVSKRGMGEEVTNVKRFVLTFPEARAIAHLLLAAAT